ncbi:MAG: hypothetical protein RL653_681 [Pseudomonadota bacterium]
MADTREHKQVETTEHSGKNRRDFVRAMLADLRALERMLAEDRFEKGVRRVGSELEMFLTDGAYQPAPAALKMLEALKDPHFTTELGLFQLEVNGDPQLLAGDGFSRMEKQLQSLVDKTRVAAEQLGFHAALMGILPTIRKAHLGLDNMVPSPRYLALSKAVHQLRGSDFEISIKGMDELVFAHDSVMVEACNSSFQVHLQVDADQFARQYNLAQALAGPLLSVATNSPLLFGKRLWAETRIALFQQSVDTRSETLHRRDASPRVGFGTRYVKDSITEIFREDIARHRTLVNTEFDEDPEAVVAAGEAPQLKALRLHNGTVYRWNRACYGIMDGKPHLRIENRVMPAGPSVADQVANAAFWCGLMVEFARTHEDITRHLDFDHARGNFFAAAREGLGASFHWLDGEEMSAPRLVLDKLLPVAESGLRRHGIQEADIRRYLGILEQRVRTGRSGSRWLLQSLHGMKESTATPGDRQQALVAATLARQATHLPVAEWAPARLDEAPSSARHPYMHVEQVMTTDLVTVHPDDAVELVVNLMNWDKIRYVLVEDRAHKLHGLVSQRAMLRFVKDGREGKDVTVEEVMKKQVLSVTPRTTSLDAIALMRQHKVGCLPVVDDGELVGVLTEDNFLRIAGELLELHLAQQKAGN